MFAHQYSPNRGIGTVAYVPCATGHRVAETENAGRPFVPPTETYQNPRSSAPHGTEVTLLSDINRLKPVAAGMEHRILIDDHSCSRTGSTNRHDAIGILILTLTPAGAAPSYGAGDRSSANAVSWTAEPEECAFLGLINQYRKDNGLGTLTISVTLSAAAEYHSTDMAQKNYFSHTLADGTTWSQNIANFGYPSDTARAENIAAGRATAAEVFQQWKTSPGHNANMLNATFKAIGIGRAAGLPTSTYKWYWTNTFGSRVDQPYVCSDQPTGGEPPASGQLTIVGGGRTSSSTKSTLAFDGDPNTSWYTTTLTPPRTAYVYFDLGAVKSIGQVQWLFSKSGSADAFEIQISADQSTWQTIYSGSNAGAGTWQTLKVSGKAQYVRFWFKNPNRDRVLGYLAEVRLSA
jgi:uncharacterized protein YkwD